MKNKSVLYITHNYVNFQKDQIESSAEQLKDITVLVRYKPIAEVSKFLHIGYLEPHRKFHAIDMANVPNNVRVIPVPVYYLPFSRSYFNLGNTLYKKCKNIIERQNIRFDYIHAHYIWTSGFVGAKLKKDYKVPLFITNHSTLQLTEFPKRNKVWKEGIKYVLKNSDHVFVVNDFMREKIAYLSKKTSVSVISNGYKSDLFYPKDKKECRVKLKMPLDKTILLNIGSLEDVKNHTLLLHAFSKLLNNNKDLRLIIIGQGSLEKYLKNLINTLGINDYVNLVGGIIHDEIVDWINASDYFVLTSKNEGSPTVMYEALACGKPFIGSRVGGIPEIITSDKHGLLFEKNNLDNLIGALGAALDKSWDKEVILDYAKNYDYERINYNILDVINSRFKSD